MKILHVIPSLAPSTGGPPRVAARLAAAQVRQGHEVAIASPEIADELADLASMSKRMIGFDQVELQFLEGGGIREWMLAHRARRHLRSQIARFDLIHIHGVWIPLNLVAGEECMRAGIPYVLQPNDDLNPWVFARKRLKKTLGLMWGFRGLIEGASLVLFGDAQEQRLVLDGSWDLRSSAVAALAGVLRSEVEPMPVAGRFYSRVPDLRGRPYVIFLSRLHYTKGLDYLADAFALVAPEVAELQLVVVGGDDGAQPDFERRITEHGIADRVHLAGPLHDESKWESYRDATCFVLPSREEAFTLAITEALAMGLPVVISKNCHFDAVDEYEAGFSVDLEADAIARGILAIATDRSRRQRMSSNATRLFHERLSFDKAADEVNALYSTVIGSRSC